MRRMILKNYSIINNLGQKCSKVYYGNDSNMTLLKLLGHCLNILTQN